MEYEEFKLIKNPKTEHCLDLLAEIHDVSELKETWNLLPTKFTTKDTFINEALETNSIVLLCLTDPTDDQIKEAILEANWLVQYINFDNKQDLLNQIIDKDPDVKKWLKN